MHCLVILCRSGNKFVSLVASLLQGDVISWPRVIFRRKFYFYKFMLGRKWTEYFWFYFTSILCIFDHFYLFLSIFIYYWQFYKFLPIFYVFSVISAIFGNIKKMFNTFDPLALVSFYIHHFCIDSWDLAVYLGLCRNEMNYLISETDLTMHPLTDWIFYIFRKI